jgi:hypothetical protein
VRLAGLLRLTAIAIALMCWLDPPVVIAPLPPIAVDVVLVRSSLDAMPSANGSSVTMGQRVTAVGSSIVQQLGTDGDVRVHEMNDPLRVPCDAVRPCIFVSGPESAVRAPADRRGPTSLVVAGDTLSPNVSVHAVSASATHSAAEGTASVHLRGDGLQGQETRVRLLDAGAVVGEATHKWTTGAEADVRIPWWPFAPGTRTLQAEASSATDDERTTLYNHGRAVVEVAEARWPITVHERRPSWGATFARRALTDDPRMTVTARTDVAPQVSALAAPPADILDDVQLDRTRVVIAGAPDALTAGDVQRLEHFVRRRGGSLVLVPDRPFSGAVTRLLAQRWRERLTAAPEAAGALRASEWLLAEELSPFDEVIAGAAAGPAIVLTPMGAGRVVVVGTMDAWRQRGDGAFDRFWRAIVARLAEEAGPAVRVTLDPRWVRPGEDVAARITARSVRAVTDWKGTAELSCGGDAPVPLRMWPTGAAGAFEARARPDVNASACVVTARIADVGEGRADLRVTPDAPVAGRAGEGLPDVVARTGGVVVREREVSRVIEALRAGRATDRAPESRHPMRSFWWMFPFVACLAAEWWLRRRGGLR